MSIATPAPATRAPATPAPAGYAPPVVATAGSRDPAAPLVVLLHGRGSHEREILALADHLPSGPAYAAVRAPLPEGDGHAWFANHGIGRPDAASLRASMDWFGTWLDQAASADRPVVLVGFSGGATFAGGLLLADPQRYAGAAILSGTLPFDAGVPTTPARLTGVPVFLAQGEHDTVVPRELQSQTWTYLLGESGAPTLAHRHPVGHAIAPEALRTLGDWLSERLGFLACHGRPTPGPTGWTALPGGALPRRSGSLPQVSAGIPQQQMSDNAPPELHARLAALLTDLPGVDSGQSAVSVPGARGLMLGSAGLGSGGQGPDDAFLVPAVGEFAHLHPAYDGSLHVSLPPALVRDAVAQGWAVAHPLAGVGLTPGIVMIFGPRDEAELDTVLGIVRTSHAWAVGTGASRRAAA